METKQVEEYIVGTQALLTKSAALYNSNAPIIADKLIALGVVKVSEKKAALNSLQSPEFVLSTLNSLLDSSLAANSAPVSTPAPLGSPVKTASAVVRRGKKESDINFENHFFCTIFAQISLHCHIQIRQIFAYYIYHIYL